MDIAQHINQALAASKNQSQIPIEDHRNYYTDEKYTWGKNSVMDASVARFSSNPKIHEHGVVHGNADLIWNLALNSHISPEIQHKLFSRCSTYIHQSRGMGFEWRPAAAIRMLHHFNKNVDPALKQKIENTHNSSVWKHDYFVPKYID